jgi:hypothetical protein
MLLLLGTAGGLFAFLTFIHFFADWLFQTDYEARNKSKNWKIRAVHCVVYTLFFIPAMMLMGFSGWWLLAGISNLFISHFIIDTYLPVFYWAKYMRKMEIFNNNKLTQQEQFIEAWKQPVAPILFITVDQILHLLFLWPIVLIAILAIL